MSAHSNNGEKNHRPMTAQTRQGSIAYSCVLDRDPIFAAQCYIWLNSLLEIQSAPPQNIFIHHTGIANADFAAWLQSRGVNMVEINPYDPRSPHCNKLQQLKTFVGKKFDHVVLMDCDTAWIGDAALPICETVGGKIVDFARPPESVMATIFAEAELGEPDWVPVSIPTGPGEQRTDRNNFNGGVYVLAGSFIPKLDIAWRRWADWCLDHRELFGPYSVHVDQVSFALALRALGISGVSLPIEWNYPIHVTSAHLPDVTPQILHFHHQIGAHFKIKGVGVPKPDQTIERLNQRIEGFLEHHFVNSLFWDLRYKVDPKLGSGVGSRGDHLIDKRKWLGYALGTFEQKQVVDVGCGDLEVMRAQPFKNYTGLDVSKEALGIASAKRPDWKFAQVTAQETSIVQGDAVVCLDVLIHQKQAGEFNALVGELVNATRERLVVSGFNAPHATSEICSFHQPIVTVLKDTGLFSEISVIGQYRNLSLVVADKRRVGPAVHSNDMAAEDFNEAAKLTKRPDLLRHLADLSRETFGFYTCHFPRAIEYPWVAEKLESLRPGQRALDLGAGLNPLPLFLARRGVSVDTVDSHPMIRIPPIDPSWNEWGFYDYSRVHPNLHSHQQDALTFEPDSPVDVVYSVSVIEHMPRATWEGILARCRQWLAKNGRLVLTIDLVPGTKSLWNYAEGKVVEPVDIHGNIDDFVRCLNKQGFKLEELFIQQQVPKSRTDLLFVNCVAS